MTEILTEVRDSTLWVTLNRPEAMNALTPTMLGELEKVLEGVRNDVDVRAVVITGAGRAFCAGADLKAVRAMSDGPGAVQAFLVETGRIFDALEAFPKPVIAAVNGIALAGGMEIALCCDLILAADTATLGDAHANFGLVPGGGGSVRLPRKAGVSLAKYLLYTGAALPAGDLVASGLVTQAVPAEELVTAVDRLTAVIARKSPLGLARIKRLVDDGLDQPLATAIRLELQTSELHSHSYDIAEGLAAFNEKRVPQFQGR